MKALLLAMCAALAPQPAAAQPAQPPAAPASTIDIIPQPVSVKRRAGHFRLTPKTTIVVDAASAAVGRQLADYLEPATGFTLKVQAVAGAPAGAIVLRRDPALTRLGREGYTLDVQPSRVVARAPETAGLFYAVQTIRQLLPPEIFREAPAEKTDWTMAAVTIEDSPRFGWRGAHLDAARYFMPHGVPAADGARRSSVDAEGAEGLRGLPPAPADTPAAAGRAGRELPSPATAVRQPPGRGDAGFPLAARTPPAR